jgi:hypothetical protein
LKAPPGAPPDGVIPWGQAGYATQELAGRAEGAGSAVEGCALLLLLLLRLRGGRLRGMQLPRWVPAGGPRRRAREAADGAWSTGGDSAVVPVGSGVGSHGSKC